MQLSSRTCRKGLDDCLADGRHSAHARSEVSRSVDIQLMLRMLHVAGSAALIHGRWNPTATPRSSCIVTFYILNLAMRGTLGCAGLGMLPLRQKRPRLL